MNTEIKKITDELLEEIYKIEIKGISRRLYFAFTYEEVFTPEQVLGIDESWIAVVPNTGAKGWEAIKILQEKFKGKYSPVFICGTPIEQPILDFLRIINKNPVEVGKMIRILRNIDVYTVNDVLTKDLGDSRNSRTVNLLKRLEQHFSDLNQ